MSTGTQTPWGYMPDGGYVPPPGYVASPMGLIKITTYTPPDGYVATPMGLIHVENVHLPAGYVSVGTGTPVPSQAPAPPASDVSSLVAKIGALTPDQRAALLALLQG